MENGYCVFIEDQTRTAEVRRAAMQLASDLSFDETEVGNVGVVVTEAAKNLLKHAGGGDLVIRPLSCGGATAVEMLAIDKGPGIENLGRSFQDGYSTAGTPGTGLGAISRMSTVLDVYSQPNQGTVLMAQIWRRSGSNESRAPSCQFRVGAISIPKAGQPVCGDAWDFLHLPRSGGRLLVADGLGHGLHAADAARMSIRVHAEHTDEGGAALMRRIHDALRPTRGAAVAMAEINVDQRTVRYTGVGNIGGSIFSPSGSREHLVSHPGTAGHEFHKITEFQYSWPSGGLLILYSDGLQSHWSLDRYPGLALRHPSLIAGVLYRDFSRGRDDTTVVAIQETGFTK